MVSFGSKKQSLSSSKIYLQSSLTIMFTRNPLLRIKCCFYTVGLFSLAILLLTFLANVNDKFNPRPLRGLFGRSARKYDHLQPLREMFANASKVKDTGKRSNHKHTGQTKAVPLLRPSDLQEVDNKVSVLLLVIVTTAPSRYERREAIRETYWEKCDGTEVKCKFFTDGLQLSEKEVRDLSAEQKTHGDIEFQAMESTRIFGLRYLYQIMWATAKFNFVYLLRVDDDYFVCLEKLKAELYHRPRRALIWGSYHCMIRDRIYVDEAWILYTSDVIERFLSQDPQRVVCHAHADQQIAIWINKLHSYNDSLIQFHDRRLHHDPPARTLGNKFNNLTRVCGRYLGIHGTSPEMMRDFWRRDSGDVSKSNSSLKLTRVTETCRLPNVFNISTITGPYKFDLRPCITNPRWRTREGMWLGGRYGSKRKT